jgi:predicted enzyme related to lactoylglutathione lyase
MKQASADTQVDAQTQPQPQQLRGISTVSFWATDHAAATKWYTDLLGVEPYFERPGYAEYRIGDYQTELGLIDSAYAPAGAAKVASGAVIYWAVEDVTATFERLLTLGAERLEGVQERGHGFITATVIDPFGNILGIMENPHYREVLATVRRGARANSPDRAALDTPEN